MAVVPVVLFHAGMPGVSGGFVGVDIFFVISGFLITTILRRELEAGKFTIVGFYERRARRILPALFVVLFVCLAVGTTILSPDRFIGLAGSAIATLAFSSNIWFWRATSDYFSAGADLMPLLHTWSLAVEEQFYLLFPLILWALARRSELVVKLVIALLCVASFALSVWATERYPSPNFFMAPTRAWELGLGALLALGVFPRKATVAATELVAGLGAIGILAAVIFYNDATPFPGLSAALPCLGAVAIIWAGGLRPTYVGKLLSSRVLVAIGLISYSLYLWHWPVMVYARVKLGTVELPFGYGLLTIAISFILGYISWKYIEAPFRHRPPSGFGRGFIFGLSGAGAAVLGLASLMIVLGNGFANRIPERAVLAYSGAEDFSPARSTCMGRMESATWCRIGEGASTDASNSGARADVLLWGDSHAGAMMPGLDVWLKDRGQSGIAAYKEGCPPIIGVDRADLGAKGNCAAFNEIVMNSLKSAPRVPVVILSARWALAAEGFRPEGEDGAPAVLRDKQSDDAELDPRGNYEIFARRLAETVRAITATGSRVVILEGVPEIGWSVPEEIGDNIFVGTPIPDAPSRDEIKIRNARVNSLFEDLSKEDGVELVDISSILCRPDCSVELGGKPLYFDDDHLSTVGANFVVPKSLSLVRAFN